MGKRFPEGALVEMGDGLLALLPLWITKVKVATQRPKIQRNFTRRLGVSVGNRYSPRTRPVLDRFHVKSVKDIAAYSGGAFFA